MRDASRNVGGALDDDGGRGSTRQLYAAAEKVEKERFCFRPPGNYSVEPLRRVENRRRDTRSKAEPRSVLSYVYVKGM